MTLLLSECKGEDGEWTPQVEKSVRPDPDGDKIQVKNVLKQLIYQVLSSYTGKRLPWGTLTGIRPTKIAMGLLEQGKSEEEISGRCRIRITLVMKKDGCAWILPDGRGNCYPISITGMATACISEFRSVLRPVCTALLLPVPLERGRIG